jgi:hypothetical protein
LVPKRKQRLGNISICQKSTGKAAEEGQLYLHCCEVSFRWKLTTRIRSPESQEISAPRSLLITSVRAKGDKSSSVRVEDHTEELAWGLMFDA